MEEELYKLPVKADPLLDGEGVNKAVGSKPANPPANEPAEPIKPNEPADPPANPKEEEGKGGNQSTKPADFGTINVKLEDGTVVNHKLDAEGNALNEDGSIAYSKEELKIEEPTEPIVDFNELKETLKLSNVEEGVSFTPDKEGISQFATKVQQDGYLKGSRAALETFFKNNPEVKDMMMYKTINGSLEGYSTGKNYSNIKVEAGNVEQHKMLVKEAEGLRGKTKEEVEDYVTYLESTGKLEKQAESSAKYLKEQHAQKQANMQRQIELSEQKQAEDDAKFYGVKEGEKGTIVATDIEGSVYDIVVRKGQVGNLMIPQEGIKVKQGGVEKIVSRQDIFRYIYHPVKEIEGVVYSQADLDEMAKSSKPENYVLRCLQNLLGEDVMKLTTKMVQHQTAKKIATAKVIKGGSATAKQNSNTTGTGGSGYVLPVE